MPKNAQRVASSHLVRIAAVKKFYTKPDQHRIQLGRMSEREMSCTTFRSCEISPAAFQSCHETTAKVKNIILTQILGFLQCSFSLWLILDIASVAFAYIEDL